MTSVQAVPLMAAELHTYGVYICKPEKLQVIEWVGLSDYNSA